MRAAAPIAMFGAALASSVDAFASEEVPVGVLCRRHTGAAVGAVYAPGTWERIGKTPFFFTASPIVAGSCALDVGPVELSVGSELQFTYVHYAEDKSLTTGWLTFSTALTGGSDQLRAGVVVVGSIEPVGAGIQVDWLPGRAERTREGLQFKLTEYWVENPNVQFMVNYTVATPRFP